MNHEPCEICNRLEVDMLTTSRCIGCERNTLYHAIADSLVLLRYGIDPRKIRGVLQKAIDEVHHGDDA